MGLISEMFPQVSPEWQVHLWEHPQARGGCLFSVRHGYTNPISTELACLLRSMTGAVRCEDIAHSLQLQLPADAIRELLQKAIEQLASEGIVECSDFPRPARSFPPPVRHYHRLSFLQTQLTNRCNLHCSHCYARSEGKGDKGPPRDVICRLIDEFVSLGGLKLFLTGGEPLLRPDLEEIIAYARSRYLYVYLSTNAYAMTPEKAERLVSLGVRAVNVSLDGADSTTHDAFRQREGSFERVLSAVDAFLAQKIACGVQTTLHRKNLHQAVEILNMMRPKGVSASYFVRMMPTGRALENEELIPTMEEFRLAVTEVYRARRLRYNESVYPEVNALLEPSRRCTAAVSQMYVRADGRCFACPALDTDTMCLGRYPEESLEEIWTRDTGPLAALRSFDSLTIPHCQGCEHQPVCKGGCAGNALNYHGDWRQHDPHFCITMNVRKEVAAMPIPAAAG